ncbi:hypothetical protein E2C01_094580 [Portunus trituberculatus]|uniref:Uncharacterized protein n=1 Tax=Portunus trituberculatus TaxID=210409 RepID=A0A5B7JSS0_PORTR|nr:hypothetical protein [Portunus trituberculatus]
MTSCPFIIFCHQHQVFVVYLFNAIDYLVLLCLVRLVVPFPLAILPSL